MTATSKTKENKGTWQFFVPCLGWLSDPGNGLSGLQIGDKKVTT